MKKEYVKPIVLFENLQMSQSIASCFYKLNQTRVEDCETVVNEGGFVWGEAGTFIGDNTECLNTMEEYCYTDGTGGYAAYMS